jgi:hypothetical protein
MGTPINRTKGQATIIFAQAHQHTLEMTLQMLSNMQSWWVCV